MTEKQIQNRRAAMALGLLLVSLAAGIGTGWAQYPSVSQITKDGRAVLLQDYASLPQSSRTTGNPPPPIDYTGQLARVNFLRSEPTAALASGSRLFVNDLNRNLYILDKATRQFTTYINFEAVFPKFDNDPGHAAGLVTFAFDPAYATNGKIYSVHTEDPALPGSAAPTNAGLPGLDLSAGYTTTTPIDPPAGAVVRQAVLVEWKDTDPNDSTFVGTAREILRVGFNGDIHPMGDLIFNPLADSGHADYGNLYIAVGDGSSGETASSIHTIPQQLDALPGKILRITPDITLRPADALGANGTYRIPTTGSDPNPFISLTLSNLKKEIYAYGLRNPHRMNWDLISNKLIVDDIGLHSWEEINIVTRGSNYGYAEREGTDQLFIGGTNHGKTGSQTGTAFPSSDLLTVNGLATPVTPVYPVAQYSHPDGKAISSGFVYRGSVSNFYGKYLFGDIYNARLFVADLTDLIVNDDGSRTSVAPIQELQVVYDSPYDNSDQGLVSRDLRSIVGDEHARKIGSGGAQLRVDIRLALGGDGEIYVLSKSDGMIRQLVPQVLPLATATITLVSSVNPAIAGANVTFTATVNASSPTGTVNFTDSGNTLSGCGAVPLTGSGNSRTAACSTSTLTLGSHSIGATYSGDGNNTGSSSPLLSQTIHAPLTGSLIGHWALDEVAGTVASDSSGNNHQGSVVNGPLWTAGRINNALSFDGVNDYVLIGDPPQLRPGNTMTLAGWMNLANLSANRFLISKYSGPKPTFLRYQAGGGVMCSIGGTGVLASTPIAAGQWYHVACTYDGTIIRVYINGVQIATLAKTGVIADEVGIGWVIGARTPANPAVFMNGRLDDIRLYDYALSAADITQLSNPVSADTTPPVPANGGPTGTLAAGTTQTTLALTTDENATCRYSTVAGTAYSAMTNTFSTTGGMSHSTSITGLSNGNSYSFYVRCLDAAGNPNTTDYTISFTVASAADTTPPVPGNGAPAGALAAGTTQTTLTLTTNENATCRYSTVTGTPYSAMINTLSTTGGMSHSTLITGLSSGNSYSFYVRCLDAAGNPNTTDYTISFSVASGADITTGLRGRWAFDETSGNTASDSSGNNNVGTLVNGPTWNGTGRVGGALSFDGTDDYVGLGNPASLIPGSAITLAGWMNLSNVSANRFLISKYSGPKPTFLRYQAGGGVMCSIGGTGVLASAPIAAGQWYHVACTYDGTIIRVYINGAQITTLAKTGVIADEVGTGWLIGARSPASPAIFMNGRLDDIRFYNRSLTAAEITALNNQ